MRVYSLIKSRRSIRKFTPDPVSQELLARLMEAGRLAPVAANRQPLEFIAVNDPALCAQIFPHTHWAGALENGGPQPGEEPTAYVCLLVSDHIKSPVPEMDVGFAAESIILTALDEDVASCAIGALDRQPLTELLGVPEHYTLSLVIALGYPAQTAVAEDMTGEDTTYWRDEAGVHHVPKRPAAQVTHWNTFNKHD
jgi:nitroreductase